MNNYRIIKKENIEYLQFNKLLEFEDELTHAYSLKTYGIGFKGYKENPIADKSYETICNELNIKLEDVVHPIQKHTSNICEYRKEEKVELDYIDGIITNETNVATVLTYADCMSLLMYDPKEKVIANIHSGWRGTIQQIGVKAVYKMIHDYNCKPQNIICCFGPSIRKDHFLVNDDVKELFLNEFKEICDKNPIIENTDLSNEKGKLYKIDTALLNKILLKNVGLIDNNLIDCRICTVCNFDKFHSYRMEKEDYQANAGIMMLKKK